MALTTLPGYLGRKGRVRKIYKRSNNISLVFLWRKEGKKEKQSIQVYQKKMF